MMLADRINLELSQPLQPGLRHVSDAYRLRQTLRNAKHFRVDGRGSAFIAEASMAIADHLDEARELSRTPYPTMWVEIQNVARLRRLETLGVKLTKRASGASGEGDPVSEVGWLIERHATQPSAHRATYFTRVEEGCFMAPLAWTWDCEERECPWDMSRAISERTIRASTLDFLFGVVNAKCRAAWATEGWTATQGTAHFASSLLKEFTGELRHIFGFLMTINEVPIEEREIARVDGDVAQPPPIVKGKPVYPLTHRDIIIKLSKHRNLTKVLTRVCEGMRKRRHEVRGHWRHFYNEDGSMRRRVWIRNHERGDESLGRVEHYAGYRVTA